jgi:hypothetical protein
METENPRLSLNNLHLIDGGVLATEFEGALAEIEKDLKSRPHFEKARTLTITISFDPFFEGVSRSLTVKGEVKCLLPRTPPEKCKHNMELGPSGEITFNPDAPENPNQRTIGGGGS